MHGEMFDTTLPFGEPELMRASVFERYLCDLDSMDSGSDRNSARNSQLSPTLRDDLSRFERSGAGSEAVEVVAACLRHSAHLTIHLQCDDRVLPLTVFAPERLVHCPVPMQDLVQKYLPQWRVMHVEPAVLRPPGDDRAAWSARPNCTMRSSRCCGTWRCAASGASCCPRSPGRRSTAPRRAWTWRRCRRAAR